MPKHANVLEQFLQTEETARRMIPWEALLVCLVYLRGGVLHRLRQGGPVQDLREWDARHGKPTWPKLRAWFIEMESMQFGSEGRGLWPQLAPFTVRKRGSVVNFRIAAV